MLTSKEDIIDDIDATLDQLIENAEVLGEISTNPTYEEEAEALEMMQEALIKHLMTMEQFIPKPKGALSEKRSKLEAMQQDAPKIHKRRRSPVPIGR
ncbi:MAG: hypothetical protein SP1CHLAM54_12140 [Chlamydiia bacterium]|nr:hypothetical protein [Chlamydiia bacterium]MCH9616112.1 hypothetical protein [Chlamydiia bacterium]MCH9629465.1 hypothetical protein [Chlamydiia bacterium]